MWKPAKRRRARLHVGDRVTVIGTDADLAKCYGRPGTVASLKPLLRLPVRVRFEDGSENWFEESELRLEPQPVVSGNANDRG